MGDFGVLTPEPMPVHWYANSHLAARYPCQGFGPISLATERFTEAASASAAVAAVLTVSSCCLMIHRMMICWIPIFERQIRTKEQFHSKYFRGPKFLLPIYGAWRARMAP